MQTKQMIDFVKTISTTEISASLLLLQRKSDGSQYWRPV